MILRDLIEKLESLPQDQVFAKGFSTPHSDRGYYYELAFTPAENVTVASMLAHARSAVEATYEGWKGGSFTMRSGTPVHLAADGETEENDDAMALLFADPEIQELRAKVSALEVELADLRDNKDSLEKMKARKDGCENRIKYLEDLLRKVAHFAGMGIPTI